MLVAPEYLIGIPITGLIFGIAAYFWFGYESRKLDRKYGRHTAPGE